MLRISLNVRRASWLSTSFVVFSDPVSDHYSLYFCFRSLSTFYLLASESPAISGVLAVGVTITARKTSRMALYIVPKPEATMNQ